MNLDTLLSYSSGDINFVKDTVKLFITESDKTFTDLRKSCKSNDWKTVNRLSHSLKSNCATLGLEQLRVLAFDIEKGSKDYTGNGKDLQRMIDQLEKQTKGVYTLLLQELKRLS
ncbi:MAG: Hpt domain-containing protein [Bacteroidota bacterium]